MDKILNDISLIYSSPRNWLFPEVAGLSLDTYEIDAARDDISAFYRKDKRPWFVGFSGGKDSTLLLQLILEVAKKNDNAKKIYVGYCNTRLERPEKLANVRYMLRNIPNINNCEYVELEPNVNETFFVMVLGKGYAAPDFKFRWCTERLKLSPTRAFLKAHAPIVTFSGGRIDESRSRALRLSHMPFCTTQHKRLNIDSCSPIRHVKTKDVWLYLEQKQQFASGGGTET